VSRVLLLCPEPLGHRHPAGVGIRFLEFTCALLQDGHEVTVLSPDGGAVPGAQTERSSPSSIARLTAQHDVAVVQGHAANDLFLHGSGIPVVVDLYDPFLIENLHYHATLGDRVFQNDHTTLLRSLREGDFFLCASEHQRLFYLGMFLAIGRLNPVGFSRDPTLQQLITLAPFGVPPTRVLPERDLDSPAILFGGVYDWYEPRIAIDAVAIARQRIGDISLTFTRHPNADVTPQSKFADALRYAGMKGYDFVKAEPWVPYAERERFFDRFALALLTFRPSLETDLSMRTRIFDYLWAGLPVITSSAPGTDSVIRKHDAGMVIDSADPRTYADAVVHLLTDRAAYDASVRGSQAFVSGHQWPRLLEPLLAFCRAPRIDASKQKLTEVTPGAPADQRSILRRIRRRLGASR
jgi:glycosyltransferase involved in cell wall biosynthesis